MTAGLRERKAKPTTIRLPEELDQWVRARAGTKRGGQNQVIVEAVSLLRASLEDNTELIHQTIVGKP